MALKEINDLLGLNWYDYLQHGLSAFGDISNSNIIKKINEHKHMSDYVDQYGLDQFDLHDNPALSAQLQTAISNYKNPDYLNQFLQSWQNVDSAAKAQEHADMREDTQVARYMDQLNAAGLNPILAANYGISSSNTSTTASLSNINPFEFITKENNKLTIQMMKSLTDIVKRLVPNISKSSSNVKGDFTSASYNTNYTKGAMASGTMTAKQVASLLKYFK